MKYEVVYRSTRTGAILSIASGYDTEQLAQEAADTCPDEDVWCEVRRERT